MANTKVSDLTSATPIGTDLLYIVDDPGGTPSSKKVTVQSVVDLAAVTSVAGETGAISAGDLRTALNVADGATANTDESIQDLVGAMVTGNTETLITVTYQDGDGTIDFVVDNDLANYDNTSSAFLTTINAEILGDLADVTAFPVAQGEILYRNGSGQWVNLGVGTSGQFLQTQGAASDPQWATPAGGGDVLVSGTPANNQLAVWTGASAIEGISALTYDATNFVISADLDPNADGTINLGNSTNRFASISVDSIDLNGTSFTGTTLADPGVDAILGWDDDPGDTIFFTLGSGLTSSGTTFLVDTSVVATLTGTQTLTNKTLTAPVLSGTLTGTYTIGGTPTFPAAVTQNDATQTLTNKTLTNPKASYTSNGAGTKSSGTFTPVYTDGNMQHAVNGGAHTLAPQSGDGVIMIHYTNNGSAGAITTSGWDAVKGDSLTTTDTHEFLLTLVVINSTSVLTVQALQ